MITAFVGIHGVFVMFGTNVNINVSTSAVAIISNLLNTHNMGFIFDSDIARV
jgi:hypothetical protein